MTEITDRSFESPVRLIYVASQGHSGSTLLAQLLGRHSSIVSLGEIANLDNLDQPCTCNAPSIPECKFWIRVDAELRQRYGKSISEIDIRTLKSPDFGADNLALFRCVRAVSGAPFLVDSSKVIPRLDALAQVEGLDIMPIFLRRHPAGVVNSNVRKGRSWIKHTIAHYGPSRERVEYFRQMPHVVVNYSELVAEPEQKMSQLMSSLGIEYEPTQLDWASGERHDVGGNRMRFKTESKILLDDRWTRDLNGFQKTIINLLLCEKTIENDAIAKLARLVKPIVRPGRSNG